MFMICKMTHKILAILYSIFHLFVRLTNNLWRISRDITDCKSSQELYISWTYIMKTCAEFKQKESV